MPRPAGLAKWPRDPEAAVFQGAVIGLDSSPAKPEAILANGADHAIDYWASNYVAAVGEIEGVEPPLNAGRAGKRRRRHPDGVGRAT
jgi:hypothetical protein